MYRESFCFVVTAENRAERGHVTRVKTVALALIVAALVGCGILAAWIRRRQDGGGGYERLRDAVSTSHLPTRAKDELLLDIYRDEQRHRP